jgi:hypothetical protein
MFRIATTFRSWTKNSARSLTVSNRLTPENSWLIEFCFENMNRGLKMSKDIKVQVCDATMLNRITNAG